jgi:hypothetical protein
MALVLANRVQETGTAVTTVSFTLTGAVAGFQSFAVIGNTNTTYYAATDASGNWEVGLGTYLTVGPSLTRTTVYASSNSGSAVTFSGTVNVFVTLPSGSAIYEDASGNASALGTISSGTWNATTIGVAYGGTGVVASSGANSVMLRDANQNVSINRLNQSNTSVSAAGATTALTAASSYSQTLTGTGGQTFTMPDATTLTTGVAFVFNNNATGTITLQDYAAGSIGTITSGGAVELVLLSNGTTAGTWDVHGYLPEAVTWGTNALNLGTTVITNGTWQGGTIASGYGGTGLTTFTAANNALYSTSGSALAAGTLPTAAGGTGNINGTVATLTTARAIYGNNFDGSAALTQIIASTYGGTGNGFTKFSGPATAEKTFTLPNATATILTDNAAVTVAQGGTGAASATAYAVQCGGTTSTGAHQSIASVGTTGQVLTSNGAGALPTFQAAAGATITGSTANSTFYVVGTTSTSGSLSTASISNTNVVSYNASTGALSAVSHVSSSDESLKTNWRGVALNFIEQLAGVKNGVFDRIESGNTEVGVSAQSLQKVLAEAVVAGEGGMLSVNYGGAALVAAIKLAERVVALEARLAALEK